MVSSAATTYTQIATCNGIGCRCALGLTEKCSANHSSSRIVIHSRYLPGSDIWYFFVWCKWWHPTWGGESPLRTSFSWYSLSCSESVRLSSNRYHLPPNLILCSESAFNLLIPPRHWQSRPRNFQYVCGSPLLPLRVQSDMLWHSGTPQMWSVSL